MLDEQRIKDELTQAVKDLRNAEDGLIEACGESESGVDWWSRQVIKHKTRVRVLRYVLMDTATPGA